MSHSIRLHSWILALESNRGRRILWVLAGSLALAALMVWFDLSCYRGLSAPDAMEMAQVARNLATGHGFRTQAITPFREYLADRHSPGDTTSSLLLSQPGGYYPDLVQPPLYPCILAAALKLTKPDYSINNGKRFWSANGHFKRYKPEFFIAIFNQLLLLVAAGLAFLLARIWFDNTVAWLALLVMLGNRTLWQFTLSGLPVLFLLVQILGLAHVLTRLQGAVEPSSASSHNPKFWAFVAGVLAGMGLLTQYACGWIILPVLFFILFHGGVARKNLAVFSLLGFFLVASPWLARNWVLTGMPFGHATFAILEGTDLFHGRTLDESYAPAMAGALLHGGWVSMITHKLAHNLLDLLQNSVPHLGGWCGVLFFCGLFLGYQNQGPRRLRHFTLACLGVFMVAQALGRTWLSTVSPEFNSENLLVLLTPLIIIFAMAFFMTLLESIQFPAPMARAGFMAVVVLFLNLPFLAEFVPPAPSTVVYPPYYPPEISQVCQWMKPDELMMSDVPWAVAWYGRHACIGLTEGSGEDFAEVNRKFQPVRGLYLTPMTLDDKFFTDVIRSDRDGWNRLILGFIIQDALEQAGNAPSASMKDGNKTPGRVDYLGDFPLRTAKSLDGGLFLTDRPRWE